MGNEPRGRTTTWPAGDPAGRAGAKDRDPRGSSASRRIVTGIGLVALGAAATWIVASEAFQAQRPAPEPPAPARVGLECQTVAPEQIERRDWADAVYVRVDTGGMMRLTGAGWEGRGVRAVGRRLIASRREDVARALERGAAGRPWLNAEFRLGDCSAADEEGVEVCDLEWRQDAATGGDFEALIKAFDLMPFCVEQATWAAQEGAARLHGRLALTVGDSPELQENERRSHGP